MKHNQFVLTLIAATVISLPAISAIRVHTIGDSTMADYDESTTDKRGWCTYLGSFFDPESVTVNNRGKSGADTRQFYTSGNLWASTKSQMSAGDYLLIQFAHNDEGTVTYGMDNEEYAAYCTANGQPAPTDARGTNPQTTYRDFLRKFIREARELGVNPVLVGPICRKYFSGNDIRRNGRHDLGDSFSKIEGGKLLEKQSLPADDHTMDYVYAMSVVAEEENVPFVNLTEATRELYLQYGEAQCTQLLFCSGDNTHTATLGANLIARRAAQLLKDAGILADYIDIPTSITATPAVLEIGEVYSGVQVNKEILLTGFGLSPEAGKVTITTTGSNFTLSVDNANFASSVEAEYAGATLFQRVYIRANYAGKGSVVENIVITSGETEITVPVSASIISLEGGATVKATWAIDAKPIPEAVAEGPIATSLTLAHMVATDTKAEFTYGDNTAFEMVRIHNADDEGQKANWPAGEIDENVTRYIDFAVTAPATMEVRITGISMLMSAHSTSSMCCHINTGFGDEFTGVKTIYERKNIPNKTVEKVEITPTLTIPAGETLHVRILPWHDLGDAKNGKYICLKDVEIKGMAFEPQQEAIEQTGAQTRSAKVFENGILYIVRPDGTRYTIDGNQVR
ncbi:MAG: hypothetical protein IJ814_00955 [Paludibacteraceae bacterium]|nr:hypothetical protein [Paludibacteraceae bacterium]